MLDMRRLNRVLAHAHGDLTATVEAGATLRDVNDALSRLGQWLPLDPPFADEATIGGILATNDSGPLRHRYGTPRDLIIGVQLATTDGVLSKAGGKVVKNVAGYDLSKLVAGSFGSLAAIVSATFKLSPMPEASKTMRVAVADDAALAQAVRTVMASQLEPIAFDVHVRSTQSSQSTQSEQCLCGLGDSALQRLLRFASLPTVVDAQVAAASEALKGCATSIDVGGRRRGTDAVACARDAAVGRGRARSCARAGCRRRSPPSLGELPAGARDDRPGGVGAGLVRIDGDDRSRRA